MSSDRVDFTRSAAERIANVVRIVETGDRDGAALRFGRADVPDTRKVFRVCTFTGAWSINSSQTITFKNQTSTPNTVVATNLFYDLPTPSSAADCAVAREGTTWFLVDAFRPTTNITVVVGVTMTTSGLEFTRAILTVQATATQSVTIVNTTAC